MLEAHSSQTDQIFGTAEMAHGSSASTSLRMSNFQESSFYAAPSVADLQYAATLWPDVDSTVRHSNLLTRGLPGEVVTTTAPRQLHHVSPTLDGRADVNLDFIDELLGYSQLTADAVAPYGASIFQVGNVASASAQSPSDQEPRGNTPDSDGHSVELQRSPVSTCTSLLNTLTLLSGTSGGSDHYLGGSSMSMEAWDAASIAFSSSAPVSATIPSTHAPPFGPTVTDVDVRRFQASQDLRQVDCKQANQQSLVLPSVVRSRNGDSSQRIANVATSPGWRQPLLEVSTAYLTDMDLVGFLNSQVDTEEAFAQPEGYCATQQMQMSTNQHGMTVAGEIRQDKAAMEPCLQVKYPKAFGSFHPGGSEWFGHSSHTSTSSEGLNGVQQVGSLPSRPEVVELNSPRLQFDHVSEAIDAVSSAEVECRQQPRRVGPFSSGHPALTIDSPRILHPRGETQESILQTGPWRSLNCKAPGDSFPTVALPMDLCPPEGMRTGMVYHTGGLSHSPGNIAKSQKKLQKLAPLMKPPVDHLGVMQVSSMASGAPNLFKRTLPTQSSPKDLLKAEDHVVRERRRRDVMNTRFQILESLLPKPLCRRDRYGIVQDTMLYVKEMEKRVVHLKTTAASCNQRLEQQLALRQRLQHVQRQPHPGSGSRMKVASGCLSIESGQANGSLRARWSGNMVQDSEKTPHDSKVEVIVPHSQQHVAIVVECRSNCGGRLFSGFLLGVERLQLEVGQCSVTSCDDLYLCSASCKPRHQKLPTLSHEQILQQLVTSLRSYLIEG